MKQRSVHVGGFVPQLEALESRWCPSASAVLNNGVLVVTGDTGADNIAVSYSSSNGSQTVTVTDTVNGSSKLGTPSAHGKGESVSFNGTTATFSGKIFAIDVITQGGNDTFTFNLNNNLTSALSLSIILGTMQNSTSTDSAMFNMGNHDIDSALAVTAVGSPGTNTINVENLGNIGSSTSSSVHGDAVFTLLGVGGGNSIALTQTGAVQAGSALAIAATGGNPNATNDNDSINVSVNGAGGLLEATLFSSNSPFFSGKGTDTLTLSFGANSTFADDSTAMLEGNSMDSITAPASGTDGVTVVQIT